MLAVDTNIVLRYLVGDDPIQTAIAEKLIRVEQIFLPVSVVLEVEWVLRSYYRHGRETILAGLRSFAGLENVMVQSRPQVVRALSWFAKGMDFGDALHLSLTDAADAFLTFDKAFIKRARDLSPITVRLP